MSLEQRITDAKQEHILPFVKNGSPELLAQLESVEWESLQDIFEKTTAPCEFSSSISPPVKVEGLRGLPASGAFITELKNEDPELVAQWTEDGLKALAAGKVAAVIMAGGQGTRLGYDGPKGCFQVSPLLNMSLFQLFVLRVLKLRQICVEKGYATSFADCKIPIYVMVSKVNSTATRAYFEENCNFGQADSLLTFFEQSMVPCYDNDGKVVMESETSLATNPNGNGGIFSSMARCGIIEDMKSRGVEYSHIFGIDNCLTKVLNPVYIGHTLASKAEVGNLCVTKCNGSEKVGVFAAYTTEGSEESVPTVVEYSEIPESMRDMKDGEKFIYGSGSICNHIFSTSFIDRLVENRYLESNPRALHAAYKKIPFWDGEKTVTPAEPNGVKMEMFIFDSFWYAGLVAGLEAERFSDFSPVKNAAGVDSPESARTMMSALHEKWLVNAGAKLVGTGSLEINPMVSYGGEGLEEYAGQEVHRGKPITK